MSDTITYTVSGNTVTFQYPMLTVTQVPVMAGRGDVAVSVRKIYNIRAIVLAEAGLAIDTAISLMHQILSSPGGSLSISYTDWDTELNIDPATYADLKGGPHPRRVDITKIYGSKSALVNWEVEVELFPTPAGYVGGIANWVDFVYSINTSIDQNFFATRTISGMLRLNKNYSSQQGFSADSYRTTISSYFRVPDKSRGFWQRMQQNFTASKDDTVLSFNLIDKQLYAWLPEYMTAGDLSVATSTSRTDAEGVLTTLTLGGFLESTDYAARQHVHAAVLKILNMFATRVLYTIQQETVQSGDARFWVRERNFTFTHFWRSNRVEFNLHWEIKGQFEGGLAPNITYTTAVILQWLSQLTIEGSKKPEEDPINGTFPYGTSFVAGAAGLDSISPPLDIAFDAKMTAHNSPGYWNIPEQGDRDDGSEGAGTGGVVREATAKSSANITFQQNFEYRLDNGIRYSAPLASGYNDCFQQIHNPRVFLLVTGEISSWDSPPAAPLPPYALVDNDAIGGEANTGSPAAMLLTAKIKPKEPTGDGKYRLEWEYLLLLTNIAVPYNFDMTQLTLRWPWTPNYDQIWSGTTGKYYENWVFPL